MTDLWFEYVDAKVFFYTKPVNKAQKLTVQNYDFSQTLYLRSLMTDSGWQPVEAGHDLSLLLAQEKSNLFYGTDNELYRYDACLFEY